MRKGRCTVEQVLKGVAIVANFNIPDKLNAALRVAEKLLSLECRIYMPIRGEERVNGTKGQKLYLNFTKGTGSIK